MHSSAATSASVSLSVETSDLLRQRLSDLGVEITVPNTTISSRWLLAGEQRLDAEYYADAAFAALRIVQDCGFEVQSLGQVAKEIFILGRFRRVYARDKRSGWPYLSASQALTFRPTSERLIAQDYAPRDAESHFVKRGWVLMSCSGTVGRTVVATERLEQFFLTHDLARIVPAETPLGGYLYAFLASRFGQALLSKDQYGSAIKHLEPHHIANVPVPLLPEPDQRSIHDEVSRAYVLRDEANALLDEADEMLHRDLGLVRFDESSVPFLSLPAPAPISRPEMPHPRAFTLSASHLDTRFDASYHLPVASTAIARLREGKYELMRLGDMADGIIIPPRFKRIYVSRDHGVPFVRPSHLPQMRPYDLGYISKLTSVLDELTLHKGEVLVTTDGTVGRIALVSSYMQGWAGSNNIGRITYGNGDGSNGYLAAFLSSPYGYHQLTKLIYGGVIDHIEVPHIQGVLVPAAPKDIQMAIGQRVVAAFEKKDEASAVEEGAIRRLEGLLQHSLKKGDRHSRAGI